MTQEKENAGEWNYAHDIGHDEWNIFKGAMYKFQVVDENICKEICSAFNRLAGYDKDWKTTRTQRVEYADLPRGDYRFEVQAVDRDLGYSPTPATVAVKNADTGRSTVMSGSIMA